MASDDCSDDDSYGSCSNLISSPPPKKRRLGVTEFEETLVDRFSHLPESLVLHILSLLPTKDAFTTCILSRRWFCLWTFLDNFNFSYKDFVKTENGSSFVEYVLDHSISSKIKKLEVDQSGLYELELDHSHIGYVQSLISRCLSFVAERKVENVVIILDGALDVGDCCLFPQSFYTCSSLITLHVFCAAIDFDGVIEWNSLTSLKLEVSVISDNVLVNLLAGCPALETLELFYASGFHHLEISSLKLKRLNLECPGNRDESLEIFAPYLEHLEISGNLNGLHCRLVDVSSVVNVKLTFHVKCIKDNEGEDLDDEEDSCHDYHQAFGTLFQDYFRKLSNATEVIIGTWFADALCMLQLKGVSIPELKCKYLMIELSYIRGFNLYVLAGLSQALPHVETLSIDMETMLPYGSHSHCRFRLRYLAKGDNIDLQSWISSSVFPNSRKFRLSYPPWTTMIWMFSSIALTTFSSFLNFC